MGKPSQRKGRGGELELARILQGHGYGVRPGRARSYGAEADVSGLPGVHVECKRQERLRLSEAVQQAVRDAERFGDGLPAVFHRRNCEGWLVTMPLEGWRKLYEGGSNGGRE